MAACCIKRCDDLWIKRYLWIRNKCAFHHLVLLEEILNPSIFFKQHSDQFPCAWIKYDHLFHSLLKMAWLNHIVQESTPLISAIRPCEKGKRNVICKSIRHAGQSVIAHASETFLICTSWCHWLYSVCNMRATGKVSVCLAHCKSRISAPVELWRTSCQRKRHCSFYEPTALPGKGGSFLAWLSNSFAIYFLLLFWDEMHWK